MPRGTYHLKLEMLQPLDWPGQPDATGTLDLRIPLNTVWKGYGPVLVSGVVQSSLLKQPEVLADLQVTLNEQRAVSVPVDTKKASGTVNVFFLSDMATAAVHAVLTGKTDAFRGVTFKLEGEATIDPASIQEWDAPISDATVPDIDQQLPAAPVVPYTGPILYLPANCGWYNGGEAFGEILRWLATYRGRVGLGLEFTGSTGNLGVNTVDWRGAYQAHALKAVAVVSAAAAAGVPTKGDGINTNDFGKGWSAGWKDTPANRAAVLVITKQLAEGLLPLAAWCTIQPYSESKDWMPADFRRAVFDTWVKAGWSKARLCGGGIAETHTGKLEALKPPALAATDNGPAIEAHFGKGVWTAHTPHVARCSAYAKHYLGRGVHASLYHRADRLHLLEHRAAYEAIIQAAGIEAAGGAVRPPVVPPEPAPGVIRWSLYSWPVTGRLDRVTISGGKMRFEGDWSSFKPFIVGKEVVATCWIGIPDGKGNYEMTSWEFMTAGNPTRDLATVEPGHLERDWRPVSGQRYPIALANGGRHGKHMLKQRTDAVWITWP